MTSLRKLRRRLLRWKRYTAKTTGGRGRYGWEYRWPNGHVRAMLAVNAEEERRFWAETPEVWLGGLAGEAALIADVDPYAGYGPCYCLGCIGSGRCEHEDAETDDACPYCLSKTCDGDCDEAAYADELDDDAGHGDDWPPHVVTEHAFAERGLL